VSLPPRSAFRAARPSFTSPTVTRRCERLSILSMGRRSAKYLAHRLARSSTLAAEGPALLRICLICRTSFGGRSGAPHERRLLCSTGSRARSPRRNRRRTGRRSPLPAFPYPATAPRCGTETPLDPSIHQVSRHRLSISLHFMTK
jgi:hypothetical protein